MTLTKENISILQNFVDVDKKHKNASFFSCKCKKSKRDKMKEKAVDRFEAGLDIRNLINTALHFDILHNLLLSKLQMGLFLRNRKRLVTLSSDEKRSASDVPQSYQEDKGGSLLSLLDF